MGHVGLRRQHKDDLQPGGMSIAQSVEGEGRTVEACISEIERMGTPFFLPHHQECHRAVRGGHVVHGLRADCLEWGVYVCVICHVSGAYADGSYVNLGLLPRMLKLTWHIWLIAPNTKKPYQIM